VVEGGEGMESLRVEPTEAADFGPCECCGSATRRVWGFVHSQDRAVAAYYVQWAVDRFPDHGAMFDLVLGRWGEGAKATDRVLVTMDYRLTGAGPAFMVVDSAGRPADDQGLIGRALGRDEVIGQPIANEAFSVADAVLAQDTRVAVVLGPYRVVTPSRPWWRFWR
jgi:hypothetical protein